MKTPQVLQTFALLATVVLPSLALGQAPATVSGGTTTTGSAGTLPAAAGVTGTAGTAAAGTPTVDAAALFLALDTNRDGSLSRDEFMRVSALLNTGAGRTGAAAAGTTSSGPTSGTAR